MVVIETIEETEWTSYVRYIFLCCPLIIKKHHPLPVLIILIFSQQIKTANKQINNTRRMYFVIKT